MVKRQAELILASGFQYNVIISCRDAQYWIFADIRYADIFQIILGDTDTDIFPFCLETTPSLSCAGIISKIFFNFG